MSCPTPCDDDCEALCHEGHQVPWKREHDPEHCPGGPNWPKRAHWPPVGGDRLADFMDGGTLDFGL